MEAAISVPLREKKIVSDGVIGMLLVLITETMFFAGLISAYIVNRAGATAAWPPPDQPRLPIEVTAVNTVVLLASGLTIFLFGRKVKRNNKVVSGTKNLLVTTIILGGTFLAIQGTEWVKLISFGLTTHSSLYGAFFYTLIGIHGAHVLVGLTILLYLLFKLKSSDAIEDSRNRIAVCSMYWYFVVAIWPVLYQLVYLS